MSAAAVKIQRPVAVSASTGEPQMQRLPVIQAQSVLRRTKASLVGSKISAELAALTAETEAKFSLYGFEDGDEEIRPALSAYKRDANVVVSARSSYDLLRIAAAVQSLISQYENDFARFLHREEAKRAPKQAARWRPVSVAAQPEPYRHNNLVPQRPIHPVAHSYSNPVPRSGMKRGRDEPRTRWDQPSSAARPRNGEEYPSVSDSRDRNVDRHSHGQAETRYWRAPDGYSAIKYDVPKGAMSSPNVEEDVVILDSSPDLTKQRSSTPTPPPASRHSDTEILGIVVHEKDEEAVCEIVDDRLSADTEPVRTGEDSTDNDAVTAAVHAETEILDADTPDVHAVDAGVGVVWCPHDRSWGLAPVRPRGGASACVCVMHLKNLAAVRLIRSGLLTELGAGSPLTSPLSEMHNAPLFAHCVLQDESVDPRSACRHFVSSRLSSFTLAPAPSDPFHPWSRSRLTSRQVYSFSMEGDPKSAVKLPGRTSPESQDSGSGESEVNFILLQNSQKSRISNPGRLSVACFASLLDDSSIDRSSHEVCRECKRCHTCRGKGYQCHEKDCGCRLCCFKGPLEDEKTRKRIIAKEQDSLLAANAAEMKAHIDRARQHRKSWDYSDRPVLRSVDLEKLPPPDHDSIMSGDAFAVFAIPRFADTNSIRRRYRQLARLYHPDKTKTTIDDESSRKESDYFLRISQAYRDIMRMRGEET